MGGIRSDSAAGAAAHSWQGLQQHAHGGPSSGHLAGSGMMAPLDHDGAAEELHQAWDNAENIKPPDILDEFVDPTTLSGTAPPERQWIVQGWLPVGSVASLYGGAGY